MDIVLSHNAPGSIGVDRTTMKLLEHFVNFQVFLRILFWQAETSTAEETITTG